MATTWMEALLRKRRETRENGVSPFPYQAAFLLNNPLRRKFFKATRAVDGIGQILRKNKRVIRRPAPHPA